MNKIKIGYLLLVLTTLMIVFFIACPIINDMTAKRVAQDIWETPLPSETIKIEKISKAGKLIGSGNGMQFFGAILIQSDLSINELKTFYADYSTNEWHYVVERQSQKEIQAIGHVGLAFDLKIDSDSFFIIYSWGNGIFPFCEFDLRGH